MSEIFKLTPEKIADKDILFNIPIYQRLFEWDEDKICTLLNDLYGSFLSNNKEPYYIGMLTANNNQIQDLVDGQQRFTVTTLIGIIFKHYYPEWNKFLTVDEKPRLHFSARDEDYVFLYNMISNKEFLKSVISNTCTDYVNIRMQEGLQTISNWRPKSKNMVYDKVQFAKYVFEKMSFFITHLPESYNAKDLNRYFESMNSLGRNLESHEILEVECLKLLPDNTNRDLYTKVWNLISDMDTPLVRKINHKDKNKRESEEEYNKRFCELITLLKENDDIDSIEIQLKRNGKNGLNDLGDLEEEEIVSIGSIKADPNSKPTPRYHEGSHHSMLNFTEFLLEILYIHTNTPNVSINDFFDVHKLSETFNPFLECWKTDNEDCKRFFMNLLKYRLIYDYYLIKVANLDGQDYELELTSENTDEIETLKKFQSMLYAGSASKTFYRWIAPLLIYIDQQKNIATANELYNFLISIDKDIRKSDGITTPIDSLLLRYDQDVQLYWFRRLDFILWKKIIIDKDLHNLNSFDTNELNKEVVDSMKFRRGGRSIEHLHPQNEDNNSKWSDGKVHEFGNLALVTGSFNSEQGNDNLDVKFGRIKQQVDNRQLQSIKLYLMYLTAEKDGNKWDIEKMEKHQTEMIRLLEEELKYN